jgi:5-methyltetrahydrofolate--homocysteine methyltransferase
MDVRVETTIVSSVYVGSRHGGTVNLYFSRVCRATEHDRNEEDLMEILGLISEKIIIGRQLELPDLIKQALDDHISPEEILAEAMIPGMDAVGAKFQTGEYFIPDMLLAARAMQAALDVLRPHLTRAGAKPLGNVVLGTVKGDHHDIGKNLIKMMLEGKGFDVIDLGMDVSPEQFVESVDEKVDIVAMSALLSTTAPFIKDTIDALAAAGLREKVKVIVGGGVVTQELADEYGADAYGRDAAIGAVKAAALLAERRMSS